MSIKILLLLIFIIIINIILGEVVTVYPETIEESEQDSRSGTPTKATKMAYSQKEQVMSIDILVSSMCMLLGTRLYMFNVYTNHH